MLRDEDLILDRGRASHGGDFVRLTHFPTGVFRCHPGPMRGIDQQTLFRSWISEIEAELRSKGLTQYIAVVEHDAADRGLEGGS